MIAKLAELGGATRRAVTGNRSAGRSPSAAPELGSAVAAGAPPSPAWRADLAAALPAWVIARLVVAAAWFANLALTDVRRDGVRSIPTVQGLFAWDGAYYRDIAEMGYAGSTFDAIRFHPLVPLLGVNGLGVVILVNGAGLLAAALIHRLAAVTTGDRDLARRAATLIGLAPPAFCLVWAYAEGPFLVLTALQLLALRSRRWWWAGALGVLASLTRPTGILLALPAAVEIWRSRDGQRWRDLGARDLAGRASSVVGPVAGVVGFLLWTEVATGEGLLGVRIQETLRGGFVFLPVRLAEGIGELATDPFGDGLHVPFAFGMLGLVAVCWKRLPPAWTALAAASVFTALSAGNLNSTERYAFGTLPIIVALAAVSGGRWWRPTIVVSTIGLFGMTTLAWYGPMTP